MGPLAAAIVFGVGSFGIAKMSGASTRNALLAGGLGALGGAGLSQAGMLGATGAGGTGVVGSGAKEAVAFDSYNKLAASQMAQTSPSLFQKGVTAFKALPKAQQIGLGVAGTTLAGSLMMPKPGEGMQEGLMGTPEEYAQAYARQREAASGISQRAQYGDIGGFANQNIYAAKTGGLAEIKKFKEGGVNYLPSKVDHDEKDYNNYVRAEGYVEDGSGNGDKDEDTMLAQLADGEFVSRADAVLGAGIMQGADPNDFKQMRRMGAKYFYTQQDQLKRIYDMVT